jgi:hypothetical protein
MAAYAPTGNMFMSEKESFFEAMTNELNKVKNGQEVFIAGDFNGRAGI